MVARRHRVLVLVVAIGFLALGLWQLGGAAAIYGKAWLAQILLRQAWAETLNGANESQPWPWADTFPVARLVVPRLLQDQIVLAGASGRSLAFGPGHLDGTVRPGQAGHSVLSGHRDTHFAFLAELEVGDEFDLQRGDGAWQRYRLTGFEVSHVDDVRFALGSAQPALTLVTCYPFDAIDPGGPLRFLAFAVGVAEEESSEI